MMKKIFFTLLSLFIITASQAQILNPVKFSYTAVKKGNNQYEVRIKAILDANWHIYSVKNPDGGAEPTVIKITGSKAVGAPKEVGKLQTVYDKEFKTNQMFFENTVDFVQIVKATPGTKKITGSIEYMVCNDRQCLPPKEIPFEIAL